MGAVAAAAVGALGCPSDPRPREEPVGSMDAGARDVVAPSTLGDSDGTEQQPPTTGRAAMRAWLAAGSWRRWRCEAAAHPGGGLSPHTLNRICNNDVLVHAPEGAPWPVGSASVKELHDPRERDPVIGYAVYLKVREGTEGSDSLWFETVRPGVTLDPPIARETDGTVAEGFGDHGNARNICVGCHRRSGANDAGVTGYGEFVFTRVPAP